MPPSISQADFAALVRRAGLTLSPEQSQELYEAWEHVEPMLERVRGGGRGREPELALIFRPEPA